MLLITVLALAAAACTATPGTIGTGSTTTTTIGLRPRPGLATQLVPFDRCDALLDWIIGNAIDHVGPYGFDSWGGWWPGGDRLFATTTMAGAEAVADDAASGAPSITSTNLQEAGVDEPDLVKTDGDRIVVVSGQRIHLLTIDGGNLELRSTIDLPVWSDHVFLVGDRVTVVATQWGGVIPLGVDAVESDIAPFPQLPTTTIVEIDISDITQPVVARTLEMDGRYVSSRLVDGAVRIVLSSGPTGFAWVYPEGSGLRAERAAEQANRQLILDSTVDNWLPYYILSDGDGGVIAEGTAVDCSRVSHPEEFSGLTALSLITLTPEGLDIADATAVFADGETVYSSTDAAYVATTAWTDPERIGSGGGGSGDDGVTTQIHRFALSPLSADYTGSGEVDGYLLSQWSMSEHDGHLRVATTSQPAWWGDDGSSASAVTVLEVEPDALIPVGSVGDLGKGERIYAVRFIEDTGYVVTFRQVDPLYVIDLSDPEAPSLTGELKIPGYSAYLHPVGDGLLLGVGQDAEEDGGTVGAQVSLFDVTDPGDPQRTDNHTVKDAWSEVEADHHAFLFDPAHRIAVVPLQQWWIDDVRGGRNGSVALILRVDASGISEVGAVDHGEAKDWAPPIRRSMVIGDVLVTVSDAGVMTSDLADLAELDHIEF
jgi:hypothetical protein